MVAEIRRPMQCSLQSAEGETKRGPWDGFAGTEGGRARTHRSRIIPLSAPVCAHQRLTNRFFRRRFGARRNHHHLSSAQSRSVWRLSDRQHWRPAFATPGTSSPVAAPSPSAPAIHMPVPATVCLSAAATDLPTDPLWPQRCKRRAPRPASDQSGMALPPKTDGQAQQPRP